MKWIIFYVQVLFLLSNIYTQDQYSINYANNMWDTAIFKDTILRTSRGNKLVMLKSAENVLSADTDLLIHFNDWAPRDSTNNYLIDKHPNLYKKDKVYGAASAFFDGGQALYLIPSKDSIFGESSPNIGFSIDFWFLPFYLENGEILFEWNGEIVLNNVKIQQQILCMINEQKITWIFKNVFFSADVYNSEYRISSSVVVPGDWLKQTIMYREDSKMLEILLNGESDNTLFTSSNHHEDGTPATLMMSNPFSEPIIIGTYFHGLIDELQVMTKFNEAAYIQPRKFKAKGAVVSDIIDLGYKDSSIDSISIRENTPGNSTIKYYYIIDNDHIKLNKLLNTSEDLFNGSPLWKRFNIDSASYSGSGQYLLLKAVMFPDSILGLAPSLDDYMISYTAPVPTSPPRNIKAELEPGKILLSWSPSADENIAGYKVYMGLRSKNYYNLAKYPLDVGLVNSVVLNDIEANKEYFIALVSYSHTSPPIEGPFSDEIIIRSE